MDLTARDAARMLNVSEDQVYAWIRSGTLPSHRVKDRYRFDRVELLEWAGTHHIKVDPEFFNGTGDDFAALLLSEALRRGGVLYDVEGSDKRTVLSSVCERLPLPDQLDRAELHSVLIAREALCSTGIGNGIAIPHPRSPIVLGMNDPQVSVAFLRQPIDYGALDRKPVSILFVIISTTVHIHLKLLSHLMFVLMDPKFRDLLDGRGNTEMIVARATEVERLAGSAIR